MAVLAACLALPDALLAQDAPPAPPEETTATTTTTTTPSETPPGSTDTQLGSDAATPSEGADAVKVVKKGKKGASVAIADFTYTPPDLHIQPGDTVTWTNNGPSEHTVTAPDSSYDSDTMSVGDTFSHTYAKAGTYDYICEFHDDMTGSVIVGKSSSHQTGPGGDPGGGGTSPDGSTDPGGTASTTGTGPTATTGSTDPTNSGSLPDTGQDTLLLLLVGMAFGLAGAGLLRVADWY